MNEWTNIYLQQTEFNCLYTWKLFNILHFHSFMKYIMNVISEKKQSVRRSWERRKCENWGEEEKEKLSFLRMLNKRHLQSSIYTIIQTSTITHQLLKLHHFFHSSLYHGSIPLAPCQHINMELLQLHWWQKFVNWLPNIEVYQDKDYLLKSQKEGFW